MSARGCSKAKVSTPAEGLLWHLSGGICDPFLRRAQSEEKRGVVVLWCESCGEADALSHSLIRGLKAHRDSGLR